MLKTRISLLAALPLLVLSLGACSAQAEAPETRSESQLTADAKAWDVASATCMRDAGFDVSDPADAGQAPSIDIGDMDMDAFSAASSTCAQEVTDVLGERAVTAADKKSQEEYEAKARETNECLREKGFDAPDPAEGGDGNLSVDAGGAESIPDEVLEACGAGAGAGVTSVR